VCFFLAVAGLLSPGLAAAQLQPHRAEYALRLGPAINAPRIGRAVIDLTLDCSGWRLKRDIASEIALTAGWKFSIASRLEGEESQRGTAFRYRTLQVQNGAERETHGRVQRDADETRAEIVSPAGPQQLVMPSSTLMPVSAIEYMVGRLRAGAGSFPALTYDAEVIGDAFLVDVTETDRGLRPARPGDEPAVSPKGHSWPVFMTFTRGRQQQQRPLFSVNALVFETGVLDRLSVDTGMVNITADLKKLEMHKAPVCPHS
jgi:hypothetical protein